ncbi:NUDIX domain-containing protein [Planococcus maritimus]|uniref:NUDIX domain-containing protein n=1 Tax=Planococcus maritimus TaxID=192421 RepID=UPI00079CB9D1|nr:NUDIX hydrolase [Planococcus maritimus]KYG59462.1 DNA mismatch repair protein MutT [Planococcus maritimus]
MNTTRSHGFQFLDFLFVEEQDILQFESIAGSFAVVRCGGKTLMVYNKWRQQWELPAGAREGQETSKECAIRELYEESGQQLEDLEFKGLLKLQHTDTQEIKYNPVFLGTVEKLKPFIPNDETTEMKLWDTKEEIGVLDEMDIKILDYI